MAMSVSAERASLSVLGGAVWRICHRAQGAKLPPQGAAQRLAQAAVMTTPEHPGRQIRFTNTSGCKKRWQRRAVGAGESSRGARVASAGMRCTNYEHKIIAHAPFPAHSTRRDDNGGVSSGWKCCLLQSAEKEPRRGVSRSGAHAPPAGLTVARQATQCELKTSIMTYQC